MTTRKFVNDCTIPGLALPGGMVPGLSRNGTDVLFIDHGELSSNNIAPRYTTQWSAGASPSDLIRSGTTYHPNQPPSVAPIFQCVIFRNRPANAHPIASLNQGDTFRFP